MQNFIAGVLSTIVVLILFALFCMSSVPLGNAGQVNGIPVTCSEITVSIFKYHLDTRFSCNSTLSNTEAPDDAR